MITNKKLYKKTNSERVAAYDDQNQKRISVWIRQNKRQENTKSRQYARLNSILDLDRSVKIKPWVYPGLYFFVSSFGATFSSAANKAGATGAEHQRADAGCCPEFSKC